MWPWQSTLFANGQNMWQKGTIKKFHRQDIQRKKRRKKKKKKKKLQTNVTMNNVRHEGNRTLCGKTEGRNLKNQQRTNLCRHAECPQSARNARSTGPWCLAPNDWWRTGGGGGEVGGEEGSQGPGAGADRMKRALYETTPTPLPPPSNTPAPWEGTGRAEGGVGWKEGSAFQSHWPILKLHEANSSYRLGQSWNNSKNCGSWDDVTGYSTMQNVYCSQLCI